jgi:hypothetical protein
VRHKVKKRNILILGILCLVIAAFFGVSRAAQAAIAADTEATSANDLDQGVACSGTGATQVGECNTQDTSGTQGTSNTAASLVTASAATASASESGAADNDAGVSCSGTDGPSQVGDCTTEVGDQTGPDTAEVSGA